LKSSARSALTEGSDSLTLVLIHPEVKLGYRSRARSAQAKEVSVVNLSEVLKDCCCRCAQSRGVLNILKYLKICRKECVQGPSLKLKVV
jgi:hypothetical protein